MIKLAWRRRSRKGKRGRFPKPVVIGDPQIVERLEPIPKRRLEPIVMDSAEVEVLRLVDMKGLSQEEAGFRMGISRGTVWRLLQNARRKLVMTLVEGKPLVVSTGEKQTVDESS